MGVLSATNKPTTNTDGKQFYIGFNNSETPQVIDLSAVGLSRLTIANNNLYVVHNVSGTWAATDIAQGIASTITAANNDIATLNGKVTALTNETFYRYQCCGVCLVARTAYDSDFPPLAIGDRALVEHRDGRVDEISLASERISVIATDKVWFLPDATKFSDQTSDVWDFVAGLNVFTLFIPAGCMVYDYFARHNWGIVGVENYGLSAECIADYASWRMEFHTTGPYWKPWYAEMPHEGMSSLIFADREDLLNNIY